MSDAELRIMAQEHVYRQTLINEKPKSGRHALDEVGRSLNAIAQRRRQYFLEYKTCNSIRTVRVWHAWESKVGVAQQYDKYDVSCRKIFTIEIGKHSREESFIVVQIKRIIWEY